MELFNRLKETIEVLVERHKKQVLIGAVVLIVILNFIWILIPLLTALYRNGVQIGTLSEDIRAIQGDEKNESRISAELEQVRAQLAESEKRVASGDIYLYLEALSKIAQDTGVKIVKVQPIIKEPSGSKKDEDKKPKAYMGATFEISASSGYHEVGEFLSHLERNAAFIKVLKVIIEGREETAQIHDVNLLIQMVQKGGKTSG